MKIPSPRTTLLSVTALGSAGYLLLKTSEPLPSTSYLTKEARVNSSALPGASTSVAASPNDFQSATGGATQTPSNSRDKVFNGSSIGAHSRETGRQEFTTAHDKLVKQSRLSNLQSSPMETASGGSRAKIEVLPATETFVTQVSRDAVPIPLALQSIDPEKVHLDRQQAAAVDSLYEQFIEQLGTNRNPNDPRYLDRWLAAQPTSDDLMRVTIGDAAFFAYKAAADERALETQAP